MLDRDHEDGNGRGSTDDRFDDDPPTRAWICFDRLGKYARHASHRDIVVELGGS